MHVVHVVRQFHPAVGGFENVVLELALAQVAAGHTVTVVTLDRLFKADQPRRLAHREAIEGIEIVRIPFFGSSRYPIAFSVLKHIRNADIVHVHAIDFFFDFLAWTKPWHGKKLVVSTHGGFFHTSFAARLKRLYFSTVTRGSISWYDGVAAVSLADQTQFNAVRKRGMVCIENGVNTTKFRDASSRRPVKALLWIGRFSQNKRLDRLISFLAALRRVDPEWTLTIAGQPWDLGLNALSDLATAAGVSNSVTLVETPSDAEIKNLMGGCSVIVSTSGYEGFGIAVVEGMSAGLFPLLGNIEPFERLVSNSGVGLIVNFDEADKAAATFLTKWQEIARNYYCLRQQSMAAASHHTWQNVSQLYQSLYDDALGRGRRTILDVPVFVGLEADAVDHIDSRFENRRSTMVAFANAYSLNMAVVDARFRATLQQCLVMNDGIGVDTASRILFGSGFPQNLNGSDFTPDYFRNTRNRYRIFFLGGAPGVAERAASTLMKTCPRHQVAGCHHGYFTASENVAIVASIRASRADVVLVAMGNPKQEIWLAENLESTGCRLGFGVGALFDFMSGQIPRAPHWIRLVRLEWLYRLTREPRRLWRRYLLGNPTFLFHILSQWLSGARV